MGDSNCLPLAERTDTWNEGRIFCGGGRTEGRSKQEQPLSSSTNLWGACRSAGAYKGGMKSRNIALGFGDREGVRWLSG